MRSVSRPWRANRPQKQRRIERDPAPPSARRPSLGKPGGIALVLLAILFWLIFYQNLPSNFGLNAQSIAQAARTLEGSEVSTGNSTDRLIKICTLLTSILVIGSQWSLVRALGKSMNIGFVAFMVLIPMSALWSIAPSATILRFVSLASIVLVCFAISLAGWHRQRFQQLAAPPLLAILVVSLVVGMMYPDRIIELGDDLSQKDAWHGITLTKNQFGMAATLGFIICANGWLAGETRKPWVVAGAVVSFICLLLSRSSTSLLATMVSVLFMVLVMRVPVIKQRYSTHVVVGLVAVLLLYELVIQNVIPGAYTLLTPIRAMTGKDGSLSGRTVIWDIIKEHIQAAPLLGTGYGAYWLGAVPTSPSYVFVYRMFFYPSEAHNGYLEIVNDLGYVGLACLLLFLISYVRQGLELMRIDRNQAALYLALLFQQLVMNMSESEWFGRDSVFTVVILGVTCMSRALHESRQRARGAPGSA